MGDGKEEIGPRGLPTMTPNKKGSFATGAIIIGVTTGISLGMGWAIYNFGDKAAFDVKIESVKRLDGHWIYASSWLFSRMVSTLNMIPMGFKDQIMTSKSGNLRANMLLYKPLTGKGEQPLIGLETEGAVGEYNRANRSLHHFVESSMGFVMSFALAAYVFPKPAFGAMVAFCAGRVVHQLGYTKGYGSHGLGFAFATLASAAIEGLNIFVAGKGFGFI